MIKYNNFSVDENLLDYHHGRKDKTAYFSMTPNIVKVHEKTRFVVKSLFFTNWIEWYICRVRFSVL